MVEWLMLGRGGIGWTAIEGASRTDRLRALGNAVVPAQAAFALRILKERLDTPAEDW